MRLKPDTRTIVGALIAALLVGASAFLLLSMSDDSAELIVKCKAAGSEKALCYGDAQDAVLKNRGLSAALDFVASAYDADPGFAAFCHANMHLLGQTAYEEFHKTGSVQLSDKTTYCGYGFYHGFMEALVDETHDFAEARAFCAYAGQQVPNPPGYAEGACYHGIGHGITDGTNTSLWGNAVALAQPGLAVCAEVASSTAAWQMRCDSGVFNSIALLYRDPKYKLDAHGNPFALCDTESFDSVAKEACYDQMNTLAAYITKGNFIASMALTHKIFDPQYRSVAALGVAGFMVQVMKSEGKTMTPAFVSDVCGVEPRTFSASCIEGVLGGIVEFGTPGKEYLEANALCSADDLTPVLRPSCYQFLIADVAPHYSQSVGAQLCASIPSAYKPTQCGIAS